MTPDIKALVATATELYGKIARAHDNLLKLGVAKITLGAVEALLHMLEKYSSKFDGLNDALADQRARLANDDYLKQDIPALAEESYLINKGLLLDLKRELQAKELPPPPRPFHLRRLRRHHAPRFHASSCLSSPASTRIGRLSETCSSRS
ncbi:Peptidase aspartic putative domain-containing protein [Camponotus japonicus]